MERIHVAAAILKKDGRILICKRPEGKRFGGLWEFPGGKLEPFETPEAALVREMEEELSAQVEVGKLVFTLQSEEATLYFFSCLLAGGKLRPMEGQAVEWALPEALSQYDFCPADRPVVAKLCGNPLYTHFIWDLDGTLMDTYPGMNKAMKQALFECGIKAEDEELKGLLKRSVRAAIAHYGADEQSIRQIYHTLETPLAMEAKPMEGAPEALFAIQAMGLKNHVYTHRGEGVRAILENAFPGIAFGQIITSQDGFPLKPAGDALCALLKREGAKKEEALMVGDRDIDVLCAKNAGIAGCLFDPKGIHGGFGAPYTVSTMKGFLECFIKAGDGIGL